MSFERVHQSKSQSPQSSSSTSQFAPRQFSAQEPKRPPTQEEIENEAFNQNKFEVFGLQLKEKHGTITPVEQEKLGVLQAKMDDFWAQRMERAKAQPNILDILIRNSQAFQTTESQASVQTNKIQAKSNTTGIAQDSSVEQRPNETGMPDDLKAGVENLSGYSLDDVRVHYNSPKPAQVQALAYTQGTEIHVAPGQEEHLPHEAWHVVQQAQGRVQPTRQLKEEILVNDDQRLEQEADVMGSKVVGSVIQHSQKYQILEGGKLLQGKFEVIQRKLTWAEISKLKEQNVKKLVVGDTNFNAIVDALDTASEVEDLFTELKSKFPQLFTIAEARNSGFKHGVNRKIEQKQRQDLNTFLSQKLSPTSGTVLGSAIVASSSSSSSSSGPIPSPASSAPPFVVGSASASSAVITSTSTREALIEAKIRPKGITNHGNYRGPDNQIMTRAKMLEYVKTNHESSEERTSVSGGTQFSLRLGIKKGTSEEWFITYYVTKSKAMVTHFGPFGQVTGGSLN